MENPGTFLNGPQHGVLLGLLLLLVGAEYLYAKRSHRDVYDARETLASIGIALLHPIARLASSFVALPVIIWVSQHRLFTLPVNSIWTYVALFVIGEFAYYWFHRWSHEIRLLWAAHSVHHSQNSFNLSAAIRLPWTGALFAVDLTLLPLVYLGFPPLAVAAFLTLNLTYQFVLHTQFIKSFGPLEAILNTPSHHLVHHASNESCLDRNFGGVLIIYDRLFGTFAKAPETEKIVFGLTDPIRSVNPFAIQFHEWKRMIADVFSAGSLRAALRIMFSPPRSHQPQGSQP
jgi:sterol desaturase/sphingolipid hydroxylase (fatty acid hydroxylase superfamily)